MRPKSIPSLFASDEQPPTARLPMILMSVSVAVALGACGGD